MAGDDQPISGHLALLKALANETRLRLLVLIANEEHSVRAIAKKLILAEPTISHHLGKLTDVGLATMRISGKSYLYKLDLKALRSVSKNMRKQIGVEEEAGQEYERRVLNSFIIDGRVVKIPETRRKRMVILGWLVDKFRGKRTYKESEINEIIKQFHPDFATIRREFIGHGLMERANGIYWKTEDRESLQ